MRFPFLYGSVDNEVAVDVNAMIASAGGEATWLHSSRSRPVRLEPSEWPEGLAKSVDIRSQSRHGQDKGRVLIVRHGARNDPRTLKPVAVLCWHAHEGNWPLTVLDCGCRSDLSKDFGETLVFGALLPALATLNDAEAFRDRAIARPADRLGWTVRPQEGAGSDRQWARTVATRAQAQWGFTIVKPRSARPAWARSGFYGERPR